MARIYHDFKGGLPDFMRRFVRYGQGNKQVEGLYHLDFKPRVFRAKDPALFNAFLARVQFLCLSWGYRTSKG